MARRSLPKIDRSLSIEETCLELAELRPPADFHSLFGRVAPLEIEIGSGKGLYLANASEVHPERNFMGIEAAIKYARFSAYRLAKLGRDNVRILRGDAIVWLRDHVPADQAEAIHVYFPDPWWKKRHRRRRIMQEAVVADMQRVLVSGGTLHFWTDVEEYFDATCQLIRRFPRFSEPIEVPPRPAAHDMDYQTHFERRMRVNDHPVFRCRFVLDP